MNKHKKIETIFIAIFVAAFVAGTTGVVFFGTKAMPNGGQAANLFGVNVLQKVPRAKTKAGVTKISRKIIAQLEPETKIRAADICNYTSPKNPEYKGAFLATRTRVASEKGERAEIKLYVRNDGNVAWFSDNSGCVSFNPMRLGTAKERDHRSVFYNPGDARWKAPNRIAMTELRVDPGEIATFIFSAKTPRVDDIFREYYQPILEAKQWLERREETAYVDMYVGMNDEEDEKKLKYLGKSGQLSAYDMSGEFSVHVDISDQKVRLQFGNTVMREYLASTGTFRTPTPLGRFKILLKQDLRVGNKYPHYRMPNFQLITPGGVGFHALPYLANDKGVFWKEALAHLGRPASHGCVRLGSEEAVELFELTEIGTPVIIHV